VEDELKTIGMSWSEVQLLVRDRYKRRAITVESEISGELL